jgi:hypothetical protein
MPKVLRRAHNKAELEIPQSTVTCTKTAFRITTLELLRHGVLEIWFTYDTGWLLSLAKIKSIDTRIVFSAARHGLTKRL